MNDKERVRNNKKNIIESYEPGDNIREISLRFRISIPTIRKILVDAGIFKSRYRETKIWTKKDSDYLKKNLNNKSDKELCLYLGVGASNLRYRIDKLNLKREYIDPVKLDLFYNITKPEIAYWLGYFWADGTIRSSRNSMTMKIQKEDSFQIQKIFHSIGRTRQTEVQRRQKSHKDLAEFVICSKGLWKFLNEHDFYEKSLKSPCKILNKIPPGLHHYFWRGYFDGDGCLHIKKNGAVLSYAGNINQDWGSLEKVFKSFQIKYSIYKQIYERKGIRSSSSDIKIKNYIDLCKFLNYIYKGRESDKIGLSRKYNKFLKLKEKIKVYIDNRIGVCIGKPTKTEQRLLVQIEERGRLICSKTLNNIEDAITFKRKINEKYKTRENVLRHSIGYFSYSNQIKIFLNKYKLD